MHYWFKSYGNHSEKSELFLLDKVVKLVGGGSVYQPFVATRQMIACCDAMVCQSHSHSHSHSGQRALSQNFNIYKVRNITILPQQSEYCQMTPLLYHNCQMTPLLYHSCQMTPLLYPSCQMTPLLSPSCQTPACTSVRSPRHRSSATGFS